MALRQAQGDRDGNALQLEQPKRERFAARFVVPGRPVSQPRHRARVVTLRDGTTRAQVYEAEGGAPIHGWKDALVRYASKHRPAHPITGPVSVLLEFRFDAPASNVKSPKRNPHLECGHHTVRPDADNLAKAVLDVLEECGFFASDTQVSLLAVVKRWVLPGDADDGRRQGATIEVLEVS